MTYYPPVAFHFKVEISLDGLHENDVRFQEVSGLSRDLGVEQVVEGGENRFEHRLPARGKFGNLVLKRGLLTESGVIDWIKNAIENFEFKPADWMEGTTSWWIDSDGVDPAVAGCHIGTAAEGKPNGRMFGEACLPDGLLVESNPGADELHSHANDIGHPDMFDCNEWCVGQGASKGVCVVAAAPPCEASAMCACD